MLAVVAAGLFVTASAVHYVPAPRSTLISRPELNFVIGRVHRATGNTLVLGYQPPGCAVTTVAELSSSASGFSLRWLPASKGVGVAALEQMYAVAMTLDPEARFDGRSHADFLRGLAEARTRALGPAPSKSWRVVSMAPLSVNPGGTDDVAVRVSDGERPIEGATIYFNRTPHSICAARSGPDGIAACTLVDQHGEENADEGKDAAVVATFPGRMRHGEVLPPTTAIVR